MRKSVAGAACPSWVVHRTVSGVACALKGGSALTRAGWEFKVKGSRLRVQGCIGVDVCVTAPSTRVRWGRLTPP